MTKRQESDLLGTREIPQNALWGIHTLRARENFHVTGRKADLQLIHSYGTVKTACLTAAGKCGAWKSHPNHFTALVQAAEEVSNGKHDDAVMVDALCGGAGTSLNMNINEVITNRALNILGHSPGTYSVLSPLDDANRFQSTNDTFPTALRHAAITLLRQLEQHLVTLQEAFIAKEQEFADVVKIGRTECQDAVLTTLGREMSAFAEAFARDRWRIYKCEERLRTVPLGGTAIGTGIAAPRKYIFMVVDILRELSNISFARAENLIEATQNCDVFVEVSGLLCACAASLQKCANDLRFLSSGPYGGIGEISLPQCQSGSSIMPGKVNPVIPEAVLQNSLLVQGLHGTLCSTAGSGHLELNPFMPLIADCLLQEIRLLTSAAEMLSDKCVSGITAHRDVCRLQVENSHAVATALLPLLGYEKMSRVVVAATHEHKSIRGYVISNDLCTEEQFEQLTSPEAVCRLGTPDSESDALLS
jgi:aspartate ammonia-lyase